MAKKLTLKLRLIEIALALVELLIKVKDFVFGLFLLGFEMERRRKNREQMDVHLHFKEKSKRRMLKFVNAERLAIKIMMKKKGILPRLKENNVVGAYLHTVLVQLKPNDTIHAALQDQYSYIHPYLMGYYSLYFNMKEYVAKHPEWAKKNPTIMKRLTEVPDIVERATKVITYQKEMAVELKKQEILIRKAELAEDKNQSEELIKMRKELLNEDIARKKKMLKELEGGEKAEMEKHKQQELALGK